MSSNFSSTKTYRSSTKSLSKSFKEGTSESCSLAKSHSKASRNSSRSSQQTSTTPSSKASAKLSAKSASKSSDQSLKSTRKQKLDYSVLRIITNGQGHEGATGHTDAIERYIASPTHSNPNYTFSSASLTEAEYLMRMRAQLGDCDTQMESYDLQIDQYPMQLDIEDDDWEES